MKRKILSTLLVLVLILSLGLATAAPVAADEIIVGDAYSTIQEAVDAASSGDTITVVAGTYTEDVEIDKTLILEGVQVGVCAIGRTGDESEIVGSIKVVSPTTDVTIDGFTITGTVGGAMDGPCIWTESPSVTVVNNVINAVEVAGGYSRPGIAYFDGITDALVGCNSFSGVYDQPRAPNVIQLTITGAGTVTVEDNELTEVGGGGGVAIMCTNANAVINILGNVIDHTGDGMWSYNSTFDTLTITGNTFAHNNACHGGACENTDTGVKLVGTIDGVVTITSNNFEDNQIQVDNTAGVADLEEVLANNTFDRAVVVDNPGSSLLPIIWSSIQDAVDAAGTGDTVRVLPGTYPGNVTIGVESLTLLSTSQHGAAVEGTIVVDADGVVVDGFIVVKFSQIPTPDYAGIYIQSGEGVGVYNNLIDGAAHDPGPKLTVGVHTLYGNVSSTATVQGNLIKNCRMGVYNQAGAMLINGNNIRDNAHCGIGVDTSAGVDVYNNTITGSAIGIEVFGLNVVAHFNNLCGNTDYGIWSSGPYVDAINNWWCHPSGPSHSPGYGVPVSNHVAFQPWLLELGGSAYDQTLPLKDGWTLFSVDRTVSDLMWVGDILLAFKHTPTGGFVEAFPADLQPLTAIFVKTDGGGGVGFNYPEGAPAIDSKNLEAGWNLIGSPGGINSDALLAQLRYVTVGTQQVVGLTTLVFLDEYSPFGDEPFEEPTLTDNDWEDIPNLEPFDGYWASMEADEIFEAPH